MGIQVSPERIVRDQIRRELPADTFTAQPWRAIWFIPHLALVIGGSMAVVQGGFAWYWNLALALIIGHSYGCMALLAHEVLHGALGLPKPLQQILGYVGFSPFLVTPYFWHKWHNVIHHGNTNMGDADPDSFGTLRKYKTNPKLARYTKLAPGSGTWYSYLFWLYSFTFHSQMVLWFQTKTRRTFRGFNRRRAILESMAILGLWIGLGAWLGLPDAIFVILVPMMMANVLGQGYIATNHFLRPQTETNNPIENSMSVRTLPILDRLHFHFSHHVEHHLFPKLGSNKAPRLRQWLQTQMPERYVCPTHWKAITYLYKTPRVYLNARTLIDPNHPERTIDISELTPRLRTARI